jgi:hypothetical protein
MMWRHPAGSTVDHYGFARPFAVVAALQTAVMALFTKLAATKVRWNGSCYCCTIARAAGDQNRPRPLPRLK